MVRLEKIEKAELTKRKEHIDQERQSIQVRLQQFNHLAQQERVKQTMLEDFTSFCQHINANLENPAPQLQQEVIRLLIDHVVVGKDEVVIKHIVPNDDDCRLQPADFHGLRQDFSPTERVGQKRNLCPLSV